MEALTSKQEGGALLGHYSSVSSFFNIVSQERIRFSEYKYLNDPLEGRFLLNSLDEVIAEIISDREKVRGVENSVLYNEVVFAVSGEQGMSPESYNMEYYADEIKKKVQECFGNDFLYRFCEKLHGVGFYSEDLNLGFYVGSFSRVEQADNSGNIPMWRSYSDNGKGVRMDYNLSGLKSFITNSKDSCFFHNHDVRYVSEILLKRKLKIIINELISDYSHCSGSNGDVDEFVKKTVRHFIVSSIFIKSDFYSSEKEYRICYSEYFEDSPEDSPEDLMDFNSPHSLDVEKSFYERDGIIIPCIYLNFPNSYLSKLILPPVINQLSYLSINNFLMSDNIKTKFGKLLINYFDEGRWSDRISDYEFKKIIELFDNAMENRMMGNSNEVSKYFERICDGKDCEIKKYIEDEHYNIFCQGKCYFYNFSIHKSQISMR